MFRTCKGILQDSETLKRVAWGLDVGTRVWPNQYKTEFAFSLPLISFIYYCFIFIFKLFLFELIFKKFIVKGIYNLNKKSNRFLIGEVVWNILIQPPPLLKISEATCLTNMTSIYILFPFYVFMSFYAFLCFYLFGVDKSVAFAPTYPQLR